jgi:hypothetical protein
VNQARTRTLGRLALRLNPFVNLQVRKVSFSTSLFIFVVVRVTSWIGLFGRQIRTDPRNNTNGHENSSQMANEK